MNYTSTGKPVSFMVRMSPENAKFMLIPMQMTKYILGLAEKATIRRKYSALVCEVDIRNHETDDGRKMVVLAHGWGRCRIRNSAVHGDDVVFEYAGNSVFTITVLSGEDGTTKEVASYVPPPPERVSARGPPSHADGTGESASLADCFLANSPVPNFKVMMTTSYMNNGVVNIPFQFACDYLPDEEQMTATIKMRGKRWDVTLAFYYKQGGRAYNCKISSGFKAVIVDADLREGQILTFEMKKADPLKFLVTVFGPEE